MLLRPAGLAAISQLGEKDVCSERVQVPSALALSVSSSGELEDDPSAPLPPRNDAEDAIRREGTRCRYRARSCFRRSATLRYQSGQRRKNTQRMARTIITSVSRMNVSIFDASIFWSPSSVSSFKTHTVSSS